MEKRGRVMETILRHAGILYVVAEGTAEKKRHTNIGVHEGHEKMDVGCGY